MNRAFDPGCRQCPRLSKFLDQVKARHPLYYARPVPPFGEAKPRLLVIGLAPGLHGANRTGRPFTGDYAGILLYQTLYRYGFADRPDSIFPGDGLKLIGCRITNAVKCVPPQNKPEASEVRQCNAYLAVEIRSVAAGGALLALGTIAHQATLLALGLKPGGYRFAHGASHLLPEGLTLFDSYHCSRYNIQTKRLTREMFEAVFAAISRQI